MKIINLLVLFCSFFHCMQLHASSDCKKNDTGVMKIRHISATYNENIPSNINGYSPWYFFYFVIYGHLLEGFGALRTHEASMKFSDFLEHETGCAVDTSKKLDPVIVQKAENFIAEAIKDRFWQKVMHDALSYKDACKAAWIPSMIPLPFLMNSSSQRDPIIRYVINYRSNFTKSEFLKCIHNKNMQGETVFDIAMQDYDKYSKFIDMVMQIEPNIYLHTSDNIIPLLAWAIKNNKPQVYTQLISHENIDFNLQDSQGWTALHHAVYKDNLHAIPLLLTHGLNKLDINIQDNKGNSALHWAVNRCNLHVMQLLLTSGLNTLQINIQDNKGNSVLHKAHGIILSYLLQQPRIDLNIQNHEGQTALHEHAKLGDDNEELKLLLQAGALVDIQDNKGQTPIDIAKERHYSFGQALLSYYKKPQERSDKA